MKRLGHTRITAALLAAALVIATVTIQGHTADIDNIAKLGSLHHYNGFIFDYFESAQSDIEGAVAVGGRSKIGTTGQYDFGASAHYVVMGTYKNPNGYPTLLLNGDPQIGRTGAGSNYINVYGGPLVMADHVKPAYEASKIKITASKGTHYAPDDMVDQFFYNARNTVSYVVDGLTKVNDKKESFIELSTFNGWSSSYRTTFSDANLKNFEPNRVDPGSIGAEKVLVINVETAGHITLNAVHIPSSFERYDLVVFNFPKVSSVIYTGSSVLVDGAQINTSAPTGTAGNKILEKYAERLIWNFPNAQSIQSVGCGIVGSVLAPKAYVEANGGSINGMLVADSFKTEGSCELHAFYMRKPIFEYKTPDPPTGSVVLYKYDSDSTTSWQNYTLLPGAEFALYHGDGNPANYNGSGGNLFTTDKDTDSIAGMIKVEGLPFGSYYFVEVTPPYGYVLSGQEYHFTIDAKNGVDEPVQRLVPNKRDLPDVTIGVKKVARTPADGSTAPHEGAVFHLYNTTGRMMFFMGEYTTNENGEFNIGGLEYGRYRLIEVDPDGLIPHYAFVDIEIARGSPEPVVTLHYYDTDGDFAKTTTGQIIELVNDYQDFSVNPPPVDPPPPNYRVVLLKRDGTNMNMGLDGAEFDLYEYDDTVPGYVLLDTITTDGSGMYFLDLPAGLYMLIEIAAPTGYEVDTTPHYFKVPEDSAFRAPAVSPAGSVTFGDGEPESGEDTDAVAPCQDRQDILIDDAGVTGQIVPQDPDANELWIDVEPDLVLEPVAFDPDRFLSSAAAAEQGLRPVSLAALSAAPGPARTVSADRLLPMGELQIDGEPTPSSGPQEDSALFIDTEDSGMSAPSRGNTAEPDTDALQNDRAPQGGPPMARAGGELLDSIQYVVVTNTPIVVGEIRVVKTSAEDPNARLEGAVFSLYREQDVALPVYGGGQWEFIESKETDSSGTVVFSNLPAGLYHVLEVKAPDGFEEISIPEEVEEATRLLVDRNQQQYEIIARNPPATGGITIKKVDGDAPGKPLVGASFDLQVYNSATHEWKDYGQDYASGPDGIITVTGLPYGRYKILEIKAPNGYEIDEEYDKHEIIFTVSSFNLTVGYLAGPILVENFVETDPTDPDPSTPGPDPSTTDPDPPAVLPPDESSSGGSEYSRNSSGRPDRSGSELSRDQERIPSTSSRASSSTSSTASMLPGTPPSQDTLTGMGIGQNTLPTDTMNPNMGMNLARHRAILFASLCSLVVLLLFHKRKDD